MRSVNRRDLRRSRMAAVAGLPDAPFPTTTKTRRAALFRRALVEIAERAARARRHGAAPRFASRPPPLAATWRARCGGRLGFARRVPKTPRRPTVVSHPRQGRKWDHPAGIRSTNDRGREIRRSITPYADLCYIQRAPRSKYGQSPPWQLRRFPTATKTRRATLFRRALVEVRAIRHARGDLGPLFASPTFRLRWPPSGEHAAAGGSAALFASPRRRAWPPSSIPPPLREDSNANSP